MSTSGDGTGDPPERPPVHPAARYGFIGAMVVLVLAIPVLAYIGGKALSRSSQGRELNVETDPEAPGFEAIVEPTPTLMITQTDAAGAVSGVTLVTLHSEGGGGTVVYFPAGTELEVPLTELGTATLGEIFERSGAPGLEQRVETLLGAAAQEAVTIKSDADEWATLLAPIGPLTVDNPVALSTTDVTGAPVEFPEGEIQLPPEQVGLYLDTLGPEETDLARIERQHAFWQAWLAAIAASPSPDEAVPGENESGLGRFVQDLAKGEAAYQTLPVAPIPIPGVPVTSSNIFAPDEAAVHEMVAQIIPFPVGVGRLRTRVLDGTGEEGVASAAASVLTPAGAEVTIIGNSTNFDQDETVVTYYDRTEEEKAQRLLDALGVGRLVLRENATDTVDVSVVIGSDFDPAAAPGGSATTATTAAPTTTAAPIPGASTPPDPLATTTVPFGVPPAIAPPTTASSFG